VREIERSFAAGCARPGFRLVHYSLQGNHAHLIVEARDRDALGRGTKAIGARLARGVNPSELLPRLHSYEYALLVRSTNR
jgi:REP element-mobilizing transposase RayT